MKYFIDGALIVWAFEADGSQDSLIVPGMRAMTDSEIQNHCKPAINLDYDFVEEQWRGPEMTFASQQVTAIEYGDQSISGSSEQWKAYWLELRSWKQGNPDFPDPSKRPVRPS